MFLLVIDTEFSLLGRIVFGGALRADARAVRRFLCWIYDWGETKQKRRSVYLGPNDTGTILWSVYIWRRNIEGLLKP